MTVHPVADEDHLAAVLGAALGHGAKPYQPAALEAGRGLGEQQVRLGYELLHLISAVARLAMSPTEQPTCRSLMRQQPVKVPGSINEPTFWIRQLPYSLVGYLELDLNSSI